MSETDTRPWVLQFCHSYGGPFLDCARQYAVLFEGSPYRVLTVYLIGEPNEAVVVGSASDEVIFLGYSSQQVRGLKWGAIRDLRRLLQGREVHLCIAHRFKPAYVALLGSQLPVLAVHHAFGDYQRLGRRVFARWFQKRLGLLGVSDAVTADIRQCLPSWFGQRIATLHNRIDVAAVQASQLSRSAARDKLALPDSAWVVGNVGRLHPDKDQSTLLRGFAWALPKLPAGSLLVIMGEGRLEAQLKDEARTLGLGSQVRFLGQIPYAKRYFAAFDVFALSSDHEPFGMVLLEAMAAGVPVLATNGGGAPEVVPEPGALFPLGDAEALGQQLVAQATAPTPSPEQLVQHLQTHFSDQAARARFWSLPMLCSVLGERS